MGPASAASARSFDVIMMVDYSAKQTRGRVDGEANGIWLATAVGGAEPGVRPFRTRVELQQHLAHALERHHEAGRRVLLGLDFCFGFPAGTAAALSGLGNDGVVDGGGVWR